MQSRVPVYSGHSPLRLYLIISWPGPGPPPCVMKTIHCNFCKLSNKGNQWNKKKVSLCIPSGNQIVLIMMCVEQNTLFFIGRYLSSALIYVCTQCGSCHMLVCPYAVPLLMMRDRVTILWSPDHRWPVLPARQCWWRVLGCSRYIGIPPSHHRGSAGCWLPLQSADDRIHSLWTAPDLWFSWDLSCLIANTYLFSWHIQIGFKWNC